MPARSIRYQSLKPFLAIVLFFALPGTVPADTNTATKFLRVVIQEPSVEVCRALSYQEMIEIGCQKLVSIPKPKNDIDSLICNATGDGSCLRALALQMSALLEISAALMCEDEILYDIRIYRDVILDSDRSQLDWAISRLQFIHFRMSISDIIGGDIVPYYKNMRNEQIGARAFGSVLKKAAEHLGHLLNIYAVWDVLKDTFEDPQTPSRPNLLPVWEAHLHNLSPEEVEQEAEVVSKSIEILNYYWNQNPDPANAHIFQAALTNLKAYRSDLEAMRKYYSTLKEIYGSVSSIAEPGKPDRLDLPRSEHDKPEKTDPPKTDPPKTDPPKTDPPKTDPPKPPPTRPDPPPPPPVIIPRLGITPLKIELGCIASIPILLKPIDY